MEKYQVGINNINEGLWHQLRWIFYTWISNLSGTHKASLLTLQIMGNSVYMVALDSWGRGVPHVDVCEQCFKIYAVGKWGYGKKLLMPTDVAFL